MAKVWARDHGPRLVYIVDGMGPEFWPGSSRVGVVKMMGSSAESETEIENYLRK